MAGSILGAAVTRVEDPSLIQGRGDYLGARHFPDEAWMVPVRSPVAHGRITDIDVDEALAGPGVIGVYTAADLDVPPQAPGAPGVDRMVARPLIANDRVRFVGEVVAVVVADTERAAADAAGLVWVDVEPLPAVADPERALAPDAPLLFPELGTNVILDHPSEFDGDALEGADVVVTARFVNQRLAAVPLEPNNAAAIPTADGVEVWVGSQNVFIHQHAIAAALGLDRSAVRVRAGDVGGGFGAKIQAYPEQILTAVVARHIGRPVRWQETRAQNMVGMSHGRAQTQEVELGARRDGTLVGIRARLLQDAGAYAYFGAYLPSWTRAMASGPYRIPNIDVSWRSVITNTTPIHAYRGAGRPEATAMLERAMDLLAAELDIDPPELRRRNYPGPADFPLVTGTGSRYDSGDYAAALDRALELVRYDDLRRDQALRRSHGDRVQIGIGVSSYVEITAPDGRKEWSAIRVDTDGRATVRVGTSAHGQGHATAFSQIVSQLTGIDPPDISIVQADTAVIARGGGTMGSRSLQLGGSSVYRSTESLIEKARQIVAHHREVDIVDVVIFDDGRVGVTGVPDTGMTWAEVAALAATGDHMPPGMEPGLDAETVEPQAEATFPFGTHVCVVEVDTETGDVRVTRHVAIDDCGTILNRVLVDGQVHGGIAQGMGQALYEQVLYDGDGNPLTTNLTGYLVPTASTVPSFTVDHTQTPSPENPLGAKGIGEAGTIGSTPAVQNAVIDAVRHLGVSHIDMPLTPARVWEALHSAR